MDRPVLDLTWDYPIEGPHRRAGRRGGARRDQRLGRRRQAAVGLHSSSTTTARPRAAAGSTAACYADGVNQAARRKPGSEQNWVAAEWGWAWPANRRILYNRASADPDGKPWSERKALVWWDAEQGKWTGHDVPDFAPDKAPDYRPPDGRDRRRTRSAGTDPFIMQADGKAWLYAPGRAGRRPAARALRAAGLAVRATRSTASSATRCGRSTPFAHPDNRFAAERRRARRGGVPVRGHHLPADRAPHRGRDEPLAAVPVRAAAGVLLRGLAGAGRRARPGAPAAGPRSSPRATRSRPGCW